MSSSRDHQITCHREAAGRCADVSGRLPFELPGAPRRYARDRDVDLRHVHLDLHVDFEERRLSGKVTHRLRPVRPGVRRFALDAVELDIETATLDGAEVPFRHDGRRLVLELPRTLREGRDAELAVSYSCRPRRGFYFLGPDEANPERPVHAWSQGQDEDSRHWWPVHDYPNQKVTTEMVVSVPGDFVAVSNGRLVSSRRRRGRRVWHWFQDVPHVPYLVTLAVGPFQSIRQRVGKLPLTTWFLPGRREEAKRCVRNTPRMVRLFGDLTGIPYPYDKYDQVFVEGFIFGGMENTTATTLTDLVLHDERASLDFDADHLISHELAHQWFGDLVTCRDWSQAWLNEGFATWCEIAWKEHADGEDEAWMHRKELADGYFAEESGSYRRPIVCRSYDEPIELFDAHLYHKGAWVVAMLRDQLGDLLFWRSLRKYLKTHREGNVETGDLRRAVEEVSGRNFEAFFDQWVGSAGHPELKVESDWDDERSELTLQVTQVQEGEAVPAAFEIPLVVATLVNDAWTEERVQLTRRHQSFTFRREREPVAVVLDPMERVLKQVSWERPTARLVTALRRSPWAPARAEAAAALGRDGSRRAVEALVRTLRTDATWGVQVAAAEALGRVRSSGALAGLLANASVEHPKARRAVVAALGEFRDARALAALERIALSGDASYFVEAEAAVSIGKTRQSAGLRVLKRVLGREATSWNEVVRRGAITGLGHVAHDEREEAISLLLPWSRAGRHVRCREAAIRSLARLGRGSDRVRERLEELVDDDEFRVSLQAAEALGTLSDRRSRGALERVAETTLDGRIRRTARDSLRRLAAGEDGAVQKLRSDLDRLGRENRTLRDRLDALEARLEPGDRGA